MGGRCLSSAATDVGVDGGDGDGDRLVSEAHASLGNVMFLRGFTCHSLWYGACGSDSVNVPFLLSTMAYAVVGKCECLGVVGVNVCQGVKCTRSPECE